MEKINNYIVVRFSLKLSPIWQKKAYGDESNRDAWIKMRAVLFRNTLFKSIVSQTVRPKKVFVLFDKSDRTSYDRYFSFFSSEFQPIFSDGDHYEQVAEAIRRLDPENAAVSRADSDDILANDYLQKINTRISEAVRDNEPFEYIIATNGFRTDGRAIQKIYYKCSSYLTIFSQEYHSENIYAINHEHVGNYPNISTDKAYWMQYIHERNIGNAFLNSSHTWQSFADAVTKQPKILAMKKLPVQEYWPSNFNKVDANIVQADNL